jgi:hypothetical protein
MLALPRVPSLRGTPCAAPPPACRALPLLGALLLLCAPPARAAHLTDVADAMDPQHPVEVDLDFTYSHLRKQTRITRENLQTDPATGKKGIVLADELDHTVTSDEVAFRLNVGLYHDLELHVIVPMAIGQKQTWDWATVNGVSVQPSSTLANNKIDVSGGSTGSAILGPGQSLRAGFGDPTIGLAWGPINEEREQQLRPDLFPAGHPVATWVLGLDYTLPLPGDVDDPTKTLASASSTSPASRSLLRKAHVFSPWTAFSKRFQVLDPYVAVRASIPIAVSGSGAVNDGAFDNCWYPGALADVAKTNCSTPTTATAWKGDTGYKPPLTATFTLGTELVVAEDKAAQQKVAFDLRTDVTWFSPGRTYTEVTDALGKLTYAEEHVQAVSTLGFYGRIARWLHVRVSGSVGIDTPHFLTTESIGKETNGTPGVQTGTTDQNPNYDYRLDQPGRRLRAEASFLWGVSGALALNF